MYYSLQCILACPGGAVEFLSRKFDSWIQLDNKNRRLTFQTSMSYFIYSKHQISGALIEYGAGEYIENTRLSFRVQTNIRKMFIRFGSSMPWVYTEQVMDTTQWNHVGFTYDGTTRKLR